MSSLNHQEPSNQTEHCRYAVMTECWRLCARDRPSFVCLCDRLGSLSIPYVEFAPNTTLPPHGELPTALRAGIPSIKRYSRWLRTY
ncbi:hypothetical protein ANCDUO_03633 [Ancylostoma duodenale]|uniref:Serine-threonine/tyrosine-protein kinase catalytic domain-containing protein n=1 Tax=Ancylostoma duodenale TaxID=51022 RepID=A0A0C2GWZ2_9BILA|nr:hypothetical protein ANCDUO_03633 [Ancylostoma duodenale]